MAAPPQLGAYRLVSKASAKDRWLKGVAEDKKDGLIPPGVFEQWADATWATDPESGKENPPMLRAPKPDALPADHPAFGKLAGPALAAAFVCRRSVCGLPIAEAGALSSALQQRV